MAQDSRVATLQHGTNFRTYYGTDAFISAHNDASDGDVITLTAGEFNAPDEVTKALTIRGEGMNKTVLSRGYRHTFKIPKDNAFPLRLEGLKLNSGDDKGLYFSSEGGSATVEFSKCAVKMVGWPHSGAHLSNCNVVIAESDIKITYISVENNSSVTCINSILPQLNGMTFDVNNCVITDNVNITNSIIKNSIIYGVSTLDNTNTTNKCLVKYGSSGFANSWYVKTEPDVNPDPWGEDPETPILWADLFGEDYHLTDAAAATYLGTDGTQVGIYGGAYPYDETPDYPLVTNLEVKGIHEDGKLQVKINVE